MSSGRQTVISVRFPLELKEAMEEYVDSDGETASEWLRNLVVREIIRRGGSVTCPACKRPYEAHDKAGKHPGE